MSPYEVVSIGGPLHGEVWSEPGEPLDAPASLTIALPDPASFVGVSPVSYDRADTPGRTPARCAPGSVNAA